MRFSARSGRARLDPVQDSAESTRELPPSAGRSSPSDLLLDGRSSDTLSPVLDEAGLEHSSRHQDVDVRPRRESATQRSLRLISRKEVALLHNDRRPQPVLSAALRQANVLLGSLLRIVETESDLAADSLVPFHQSGPHAHPRILPHRRSRGRRPSHIAHACSLGACHQGACLSDAEPRCPTTPSQMVPVAPTMNVDASSIFALDVTRGRGVRSAIRSRCRMRPRGTLRVPGCPAHLRLQGPGRRRCRRPGLHMAIRRRARSP